MANPETIKVVPNLDETCRICHRSEAAAGKMRPLFSGDRLAKIVHNVMHFEVKNIAGLPRGVCEKCLDCLKKFSNFQVAFRRSEEFFKATLEKRKTAHMDELHQFARNIDLERQKEKESDKKCVTAKPKPGKLKKKKKTINIKSNVKA